ncbi:MAG: hypothetical protein NWR72_17530, partial [Bacteroidia bacterium]|nr:hypothetical protein [Bacteroidia bacterium]
IKIKSLTRDRQFLFAAICFGIVSEIAMRVAIKIWGNNMPIAHVYCLVEFCLLLSVFYHGSKGLIPKKIYWAGMIGFVLAGLTDMIVNGSLWKGHSVIRSLESILLIAIALYYFFDLLRHMEILHPEKTFLFWIGVAMLVYFGGNLLVFIYYNHFQQIASQSAKAKELMLQIVFINYVLNIFLYTLYSIALLCQKSKTIPKFSLSQP